MKSELRSAQEAHEIKRQEALLIERHTEDLTNRFVEVSERVDRQNVEMLEMRRAFDTNPSETISFLSGKFKSEFEALKKSQTCHCYGGGRVSFIDSGPFGEECGAAKATW